MMIGATGLVVLQLLLLYCLVNLHHEGTLTL
jgi:hypothetical protein